MKELKCPKCGNVFTVDESDYADIVNQVKNAEFESELNRRMKDAEKLSRICKEFGHDIALRPTAGTVEEYRHEQATGVRGADERQGQRDYQAEERGGQQGQRSPVAREEHEG